MEEIGRKLDDLKGKYDSSKRSLSLCAGKGNMEEIGRKLNNL
jgi:hypothetical protein